jgi:DMSO/TMAO reductase YedYZ molybdopterin-dependent catalytic subunit
LTVVDAHGERRWTYDELARFDLRRRAVLDCTSGWYAVQDWEGAPLSALCQPPEGTRSILVRSVTGYWLRLPVQDLDHLLVATRVGGLPLSPGHGYPARLVAPGRRGFWWVKWVDRVEAQTTPWWWQPPFPLT